MWGGGWGLAIMGSEGRIWWRLTLTINPYGNSRRQAATKSSNNDGISVKNALRTQRHTNRGADGQTARILICPGAAKPRTSAFIVTMCVVDFCLQDATFRHQLNQPLRHFLRRESSGCHGHMMSCKAWAEKTQPLWVLPSQVLEPCVWKHQLMNLKWGGGDSNFSHQYTNNIIWWYLEGRAETRIDCRHFSAVSCDTRTVHIPVVHLRQTQQWQRCEAKAKTRRSRIGTKSKTWSTSNWW